MHLDTTKIQKIPLKVELVLLQADVNVIFQIKTFQTIIFQVHIMVCNAQGHKKHLNNFEV